LLVSQRNPRTVGILAVAKANKLDLEVVTVDTKAPTAEYLKLNKLGKVPTFVGSDGYVLTECIAIAIYGGFPVIRYTLHEAGAAPFTMMR
jgi:elongation factor 1-gamma